MKQYSFEKLIVWQEARVLVKSIYTITRTFPKEEIFGITSQMRQAAISICSNIAEGSGRTTKPDQSNFYRISYSSLLELLNQLIPKIIDIATKTGIQNIGDVNEKLPNFCLPPDELKKILTIRNALVDKLNSVNKTINSLKKIIDPLNTVVTTTTVVLQTLNNSIDTIKPTIFILPSAAPGFPSPPAIATSAIDTLRTLVQKTTPKITKAQNTISSIAITMDFVNNILLKIIGLLNSIDKYLKGCNATSNTDALIPLDSSLIPLDSSLIQLEQEQIAAIAQSQNVSTLSNYKGFTLEVITEPYSPTVNRVKAVAKNAQGIILLQTPLSFTTQSQILIEEIKLIIDSNNLKAN
jgi:four helix bundle protein